MDRTKLFAVATAASFLVAGALLVAGTASAENWKTYQGEVYAGHAYGILVPAKAESLEFGFESAEGTARFALFDPAGAKVGFYALDADTTSATIVAPKQGRYVAYVYEVGEAPLRVRVNAEEASVLDLQQVRLAREDHKLDSVATPAKLDKVLTMELRAAPAFVTLLYEGSAKDLDATVSGKAGEVLRVEDETGTALSPGVFSAQAGTRTSTPENLDGLAYTVEIHAERFEGRLVLTALSIDFATPLPKHVHAPRPAPTPLANGTAVLPAAQRVQVAPGEAVAFHASAGKLVLSNVAQDKDKARDHGYGDLLLYAPDDKLVGVFTLGSSKHNVTVELPVSGEYVAYAREGNHGALFVQPREPGPVRALPLVKEEASFAKSSAFQLNRSPVDVRLRLSGQPSALTNVVVSNAKGEVASTSALVNAPGFAWTRQTPENFQAGAHEIDIDGLLGARVTLVTTSYVREATLPAHEPHAAGHAPAQPAKPSEPSPFAPPPPPSDLLSFLRL